MNKRRSLIPDILVTTAEAAAPAHRGSPHASSSRWKLSLPGSHTMDRFAKPALYAEAGIPFYWRIETVEGVEVHAHRLDPVVGVYVENGLFTTLIDVARAVADQAADRPVAVPPPAARRPRRS